MRFIKRIHHLRPIPARIYATWGFIILDGDIGNVNLGFAQVDAGADLDFQSGSTVHACDFAGRLNLTGGINAQTTVNLFGPITTGGLIDLKNGDVAGSLHLHQGGSGSIVSDVTISATGTVTLADGAANAFSGSAKFAGIDSGGIIETVNNADLDGVVAVIGDASGSVNVAGVLVGDINVTGYLHGSVTVTGVVNGDIDIDGDVTSTGSVHLASTLRAGRVLVDGLLDGPVTIDDATGSLSQINLFGGVGPSGRVVINANGGNFNADGDIWVGSTITLPPLSPIDFDGCIQVNDNAAVPPGFGNFNGDITVVGCHDFGDTVPVCVEGMTNGRITLVQSLCPDQATLDTSCPACP